MLMTMRAAMTWCTHLRTPICIFVCTLLCTTAVAQTHSYPSNEYEYSVWRQQLVHDDAAAAGWRFPLDSDELIVDHYLQYLKWAEFIETKDTGFYASRPVEEVMDYVRHTRLYDVLRQLPKGGNMHSHENHQLSKRTLYNIVWNSTDFQHLWILPENHTTAPWTLNFFINPPPNEGWVRVQDDPYYSLERVLQNQVFLEIMDDYARRYPTDSGERWRQMDALWTRGSDQLIANVNIKSLYLEALLVEQLEEGVQYYEARQSFANPDDMLYVLDPAATATYGKRFVDVDGELAINMTLTVVEKVKQRFPHFIDMKRIIYTYRRVSSSQVQTDMDRVLRLRQLYPTHILGYDMVGEEDAGYSHLHYIDNFFSLYDSATGSSLTPLYFHGAETNWYEDLITSKDDLDPVATAENMFEAYLLQSKRVGHGYALVKHPHILSLLKQRNVAIEVCPVSNQILGFTPDLRNHPALHYFRTGHPIVLGADDPGTFGYDHFTIDWHQVFMAWGLTLSDLKTLAYNSLIYSGMTSAEQQPAIQKWTGQWSLFISNMRAQACSYDYTNTTAKFGRIFPLQGSKTAPTNVTVYGRNFERAICQRVVCKFGEVVSTLSVYVSNYKIICQAAPPSGSPANNVTVPVSVSLDGGTSYTEVGNFTFHYDTVPTANTATPRYTLSLMSLVSLVLLVSLRALV